MPLFERNRLAVSIDGTSLRLLSCRRRSVLWWADLPLDPRLLRQGFLVSVSGFADALAASPQNVGRLKKGKVLAALPGIQHVARTLSVPKEARNDLDAIVAGEVRRSFSGAENNTFVFWQSFGPKKALQQSVFLVAVPRQPLITFLEALRAARIDPSVLDLRPLAIARAINLEEAIIANSESRGLDVVIVSGGVPVLMRSLHLGEDYDSVEDVNGRLVDELARTVAHFNATNAGGPLAVDTAVYLTGSGASDSRLPSAVEDATHHRVGTWQPAFDYPDDFPAADFVVELGLMLK